MAMHIANIFAYQTYPRRHSVYHILFLHFISFYFYCYGYIVLYLRKCCHNFETSNNWKCEESNKITQASRHLFIEKKERSEQSVNTNTIMKHNKNRKFNKCCQLLGDVWDCMFILYNTS